MRIALPLNAALILFLALTGCGVSRSSSFLDGVEVVVEPTDYNPGPCFEPQIEQLEDGPQRVWQHVGFENCLTFDPPRTIRGAWLYEFEASLFFEDREALPDGALPYRDADGSIVVMVEAAKAVDAEVPECGAPFRCAFVVEFIGRRSNDSRTEELSGRRYVYLMDRIVSIRKVKPPRRPTERDWDAAYPN